ncbi:MAG TPA: hypothetical protein VLJ76_07905 [Gaiellaceae bacterium]|nr:hypothetical protein [Gaiellaceae bacterium]
MSNYEQRMQDTYSAATGVGWAAYAGLLLLASGAFDVIGGIALLAKNSHLAGGLFWGRPFWGVVFLIVGGATLYCGFGVLTKMPGTRSLAIVVTIVSGFAALLWSAGAIGGAQTVWVEVGIAVDLIVLYALVARGEGAVPKA